jgi:hypothetical protein
MAEEGHEYLLPQPRMSGRCRLAEATFTGMRGKEEDAPIPAVRGAAVELVNSTLRGHSWSRQRAIESTRD